MSGGFLYTHSNLVSVLFCKSTLRTRVSTYEKTVNSY